jgi:hypothetical protein
MPVTPKDLSARLSKRLANYKLSDAVIKGLTDRVLIEGLDIVRFNPCIYGICIDYYTDKMPRLDLLNPKQQITRFEVFPYGIIDWDRFHVRIAFGIDELEGKAPMRGFDS